MIRKNELWQEVVSYLLKLALVLLVYTFVNKFYYNQFFYGIGLLGSPFEQTHIFNEWSFIVSLIKYPKYSVYFLVVFSLILVYRKNLTWNKLGLDKYFRGFIFIITATLAWTYSFYGYNLFFDHYHLFDRLIIVLTSLLVLVTPYALFLFVPLVLVSMAQMNIPLGGYSITDKAMLYNVLFVILSWLLVKKIVDFLQVYIFSRLNRQPNRDNFNKELLLALCLIMVAASYFVPFLMKVSISPNFLDWPLLDRMSIGTYNYFGRGWLNQLDDSFKVKIVDFVSLIETPLLIVAFLTEFAVIFIFINRKLSLLVLIFAALLHIGIFSLSGIFFWKWIILDLTLAYFVIRNQRVSLFGCHGIKYASLFLVLISWYWAKTPKLGWYYTGILNTYDLQVNTDNGDYLVSLNDMAPYDIFFSFHRWNVNDKKVLPMSVIDADLRSELTNFNLEDLDSLIEAHGKVSYKEEFVPQLKEFLNRYFSNYNSRPEKYPSPFSYLQSFHHVYFTPPNKDIFKFNERVKSVSVLHTSTFFEDFSTRLVRTDTLFTVPIL